MKNRQQDLCCRDVICAWQDHSPNQSQQPVQSSQTNGITTKYMHTIFLKKKFRLHLGGLKNLAKNNEKK